MPFVINPTRKRTFTHVEGEDKFEADFDFVCMEDGITKEIKEKLRSHNLNSPDEDAALSIVWHQIRRSLKATRGIIDERTGQEVDISNSDIQRAVFEFIISFGNLREQILTAYIGPSGKNSNSGATQQ
jgi:hypothetical protein